VRPCRVLKVKRRWETHPALLWFCCANEFDFHLMPSATRFTNKTTVSDQGETVSADKKTGQQAVLDCDNMEFGVDMLSPKKPKSINSEVPLNLKYKPQNKLLKEVSQHKSSPRPLSNRAALIQIPLPKIEENPSAPSNGCTSTTGGDRFNPHDGSADADTPSTVEATTEHGDAPISPMPFLIPRLPSTASGQGSDMDEDESSLTETPRSLTYDELRAYQRPFMPNSKSSTSSSRPTNVPTLRIRRALPANTRPDFGAVLQEEFVHCRETIAASAAGRAISDVGAAIERFAERVPQEISNNPLLRRCALSPRLPPAAADFRARG
jgi:hypothetical protein